MAERLIDEIEPSGKLLTPRTQEPARRGRANPLKMQVAVLFLLLAWEGTGVAKATQLKPVTVDAFQHYVALTEARMATEINGPNPFLWVDQLPPERRAAVLKQLRDGQVITQPLETRENGQPIPIPEGMVHHWLAVVFVPGVTLAQTIAQQQDFDRSASIYGPDIQQSKLLQAHGNDFRVYYRIHRHVLIESPTYNATFDIQFFPLDRTHEYSRSYSTRIAEIIDPGTPKEREKPVGQDLGYLWRLNTYTRYEQRDGGVYIQTEFIALSRSVPAIFAWLVNPYVRSVPQEYLVHILGAARNDLMNSHEAVAAAATNLEAPAASNHSRSVIPALRTPSSAA
jgi:hypothetical protein